MKKAEREHLSRVAALGCVVCRNLGFGASPAECHHIRSGQGLKRASHYEVLPLCAKHHRLGGYGIALHAGRKEWERRYGTELQLLEQVRVELAGLSCSTNQP